MDSVASPLMKTKNHKNLTRFGAKGLFALSNLILGQATVCSEMSFILVSGYLYGTVLCGTLLYN